MEIPIKKLIKIFEKYQFDFWESDVQCELFNILKQQGYLVRSEYPKRKVEVHDLSILNKQFQITHPIEIKVRGWSLKRTEGFLCEKGEYHGGRHNILKRKDKNNVKEGSVIFFNIIKSNKKSLINGLSEYKPLNSSKKYAFITTFYVELIRRPKEFLFNGGLKITRNKIQRM
jgi:hypothetical protein